MDLPLPLIEEVLAGLPLRSLLAVAAASKGLRSLVASPSFATLHSRFAFAASPWFFFFGFNLLLPHRSQAFAFDPVSFSWLRLPLSPFPPHNSSSLSSSHSSLYALSGPMQTHLCIAPSPMKQNWQIIEAPMRIARRNPLVGIFYHDPCKLDVASIVVAGGVDHDDKDEEDELAVEEYNAEKGEWERGEAMPEALRGKSVVAAMAGGRWYVGDRGGGVVCCRGEGGTWVEGKVEKGREVREWEWVGSEVAGLLAVAACEGGRVKVYRMEEEGGRMREVAEMPADMRQLFQEEGEEGEAQVVRVRCCAGGGNLLYVYSDSPFKEYAACACEMAIDGGTSRWYRLPPMPAPLHRFDRVSCLSASVPLPSCINS
ncbi:hypothetical protein GOP47_0017112 [Adiantum capillus-veneris]|uniref:F-box domain-containing protein n=1 Tax=Adiantum capillus-veneris TaxID=13818 RepID=A0A9D4ZCB5_ADICA|nr:hypothetical protein GOP47_0017112 [Adiantum capillus-veneris]